MGRIYFFAESINFKVPNPRKTSTWLKSAITKEKRTLQELNFVFCSDKYLHKINLEYLNHDTYTDIITFDNSDVPNDIEGDIYISIPRVMDNAKRFEKTFDTELRRVLVHGVLHLAGYNDKSLADKERMRKREDFYLGLWK